MLSSGHAAEERCYAAP